MPKLGGVTIPAPQTTSTAFPLKADFPYSFLIEPQVYIHQFGDLDAKVEQRFTAGNGQRKYQFRKAVMTRADREALTDFWIAAGGPLTEFPFARPNSDGSTTTVTCRFADPTLTLDGIHGSITSAGITFVEVFDVSTAPSYSVTSTVTRGPIGGALAVALLTPVQTLIPLLTIQPTAWQTSIWGSYQPALSAAVLGGDTTISFQGLGTAPTLASGSAFILQDVTYTTTADATITAGAVTSVPVTPALAAAPQYSPVTPLYPAITVSDRLCTVGGVVYQPRLLDWDGIQQSTGGGADSAGFILGNADRIFSAIANTVDLKQSDVQFALYHVNTSTLINLWRGFLTKFRITAKPEFTISCADGIYELTLPFPVRRISHTCQKKFNVAESNCPYASAGTAPHAVGAAWGTGALLGVGNGLGINAFGVGGPGSMVQGVTSINIGNLVNSSAILSGDRFTVLGETYTVTAGTSTDSIGNATVHISPPLRETVNDGSTVVALSGGDPTTCDKTWGGYNGCQAHGMDPYFGGIDSTAQSVDILDNSTGIAGFGRDHINSTSQISDSVYDQVIPEIYIDWLVQDGSTHGGETTLNNPADPEMGFPVSAKIVAGREESDFYAAIGIVGEGPIAYPSVTENTCEYFLDNVSPFGWPSSSKIIRFPTSGPNPTPWGVVGLRRGNGHDPAQNNDPDGGSDQFSLDQGGGNGSAVTFGSQKAGGTAFCQIRKSDTPGVQVSVIDSHSMQIPVRYGLPGYTWSGGTRSLTPSINNPVWIALNAYLKGRGVWFAPAAVQEKYFDVTSAQNAGAICDTIITKLLETGTAKQFKFTGILQEEKPLRTWMQEILNNCLGMFTFSFGQLVLDIRVNSSAVEAFTAGNFLFNSVVLDPIDPAFNYLSVNFADEEFGYAGNSVTIYNEDHAVIAGGTAGRPRYTKKSLNLAGVATKDQGGRLISVRLCEELGGVNAEQFAAARIVTFQTTVLALNVRPGMVCSLTAPDVPDYPQQLTTDSDATPPTPNYMEFRVTSWKLNKDFSISITGQTTNWDMYDVAVGPKPADVVVQNAPTESLTPADWSFSGATAQDGVLNIQNFACAQFSSAVSSASIDIYYCPEQQQTEMFTPSGCLAADTTIDYGTYGTLPVVGEWISIEGEVMVVTAVTPSDAYHGTVTVVRGQAGTTAADHARVSSTLTSHNAAWLAEWTVPTALDIHAGDGFVVNVSPFEEAVVGEYVPTTGLLRTTLPLATAVNGDAFLTVPVMRAVTKLTAGITFPPRFFPSNANLDFVFPIALPYAGVVAIEGTLTNNAGLTSLPVTLTAQSEVLMVPLGGPVPGPFCLRTLGSTRYILTATVGTGTTPQAFPQGVLVAESQPFEDCYAEIPPIPGEGPLPPPPASSNPVPVNPTHGGSITVTHTCSGWEQVTVAFGKLKSTWRADIQRDAGALITTSTSTAALAASMAAFFNAEFMGSIYSFTVSGSTIDVTWPNGTARGLPITMTVTNTSVSPYFPFAAGVLTLTYVPLAPALGVLTGRLYAYAMVDTGAGYRSQLSAPTLSSGPSGANTQIWISTLPAQIDTRADTLEIYACADGQTPATAIWRRVASILFSASLDGYFDTTTETALASDTLYPGPTQPGGSGDVIVTVTRDGYPYVEMRIPPGGARSNSVGGVAMFVLGGGRFLGAKIVNNTAAGVTVRTVAE